MRLVLLMPDPQLPDPHSTDQPDQWQPIRSRTNCCWRFTLVSLKNKEASLEFLNRVVMGVADGLSAPVARSRKWEVEGFAAPPK